MDNLRYLHCDAIYTDGVYRINDVRRLGDGRLFSIGAMIKNSGNSRSLSENTNFVYGRVSEDEGRTWRAPTFMYEMPDRLAWTVPGDFIVDRDGRVHLFLMHITHVSMSTDDPAKGDIIHLRFDSERGENPLWQKIEALDRYTGAMNNVIQLAEGRIIAPFSTISGTPGSFFVSSVVYSDDGGDSWRASNDVKVFSDESHCESGAVEPVVVEGEGGVLIMLIRTVLGVIYYSLSRDRGASWTSALPTRIPSSNAPSVPQRMPDGRVLLAWNDALGQPMTGVRYSFARQCLHAAVSRDGLRTLEGMRMIVRKRRGDPDNVLNCYPFAECAGEDEVFLRPFSVTDREGATWAEPQGTLLRLKLSELAASEMENAFDEWVTDCEADASGLTLRAAHDGLAYACVNFPYGAKGEISLSLSGALPDGARLLMSNCYLDRLTFAPGTDGKYGDVMGRPYVELPLLALGEISISWDERALRLRSDAGTEEISLADWDQGFNHMMLLFEGGEGALTVRRFTMRALETKFVTGITY